MRFQHVLGALHLGTLAVAHRYDYLCDACRSVPSRAYVESLVRLAALLHDVGHGPFGHFFDDHYLDQFGITHETIGSVIIEQELGELLRGIRRNPNGTLQPLEVIDPHQIAWLIQRPRRGDDPAGHPDWLRKLRALFSGIYTVDNMDFVLRDAYMTGINTKAFDLSRLLHYTFFTPQGLTIHSRGLPTLINFIETRANLFRTVYFHRTVRALDLALEDLFGETMQQLFTGNPLDKLADYRRLTETSFLVDVQRWADSAAPPLQALGQRWQEILGRRVQWKMACERMVNFHSGAAERTTIFSERDLMLARIRERLPSSLRDIPLKTDTARHYHRPNGRVPTVGQNFLLDAGVAEVQELHDDDLFRALPISFVIFRLYSHDHRYDSALNQALTAVLGEATDAKTNM
jgi:HD superfamily phosphohydrolase